MTSSLDAVMAAAKYWGTSTGTANKITTNIGTGDRSLQAVLTHLSAFLLGPSTYDGSTAVYYSSDGGVLLQKYTLTTKSRAVATA
jgi:hypothetical protein